MYAKRVNSYIARTLIEDSATHDERRSPPALTRVHSPLSHHCPSTEPPHSLYECNVKLSRLQATCRASVKRRPPALDTVTPSKFEADICKDSPAVKRRLFDSKDSSLLQSRSLDANAHRVRQFGRLNGSHPIEKLFTSSLNGKSLGAVDHYEDGLLAIANAACLMSTGVLDRNRASDGQGLCC